MFNLMVFQVKLIAGFPRFYIEISNEIFCWEFEASFMDKQNN